MPGLGRYPCTSCHYIASNRRMLARHAALIHCDKVFKCPLCPFITRYAANWYRHKRDLHGLTKLTTCDTCGFSASSTPELAQHREAEHPELLQLDKFEDKYAKEKVRLSEGPECRTPEVTVVEKDIRNDSDLLLDIYDIDQEIDITLPPNEDDVSDENGKSSSLNGHLNADLEEVDPSGFLKECTPDTAVGMNEINATPDNLRPLRIRRSYNCDQCGLITNNPREYLYHLRGVHGEKISVHECKYCIYASKHIQKLQRHCNLVHRQQLEKDPEFKKVLETTKDKKTRPDMINMGMPLSHPSPNENFRNSGMASSNKPPVKNKPQAGFFKCNVCSYQTRNKTLMFHHNKTAHIKKKNFRCGECGYVTNEKARYTKHIKYHNLPKLQCEYCFFKTAYKWNMERHMKNHEVGAEGDYHCTECNFTTSTKQSFNSHVTNHHDPSAEDVEEDQEFQEINGENDSGEWEDINVQEDEDDEEGVAESDNNFDSYEFSETSENPENVWKQGKSYERNLKCQQCDFRAAWPFELKKHEENHRSQKKHPCPLCGMRFEHIAWLTKHLRRIHGENSQAKNIAAAFDLLKPPRRRPGKEYAADAVLPMFQEVLKQNNVVNNNNNGNNKNSEQNKGSMLSSLLKKPLHQYAPSSVSKYNAPFKSKTLGPSSNLYKQPRISNYYPKVSTPESPDAANGSSKKVPTCNVCGYKTRWLSELQRHMRVHSQEKPFQCHKCKYVCKWKGDLNRHLLKYHGIKMPPSKKTEVSKLGMKKSSSMDSTGEWQNAGSEKRNAFPSSGPVRNSQESPLDLTLGRETFPHPNAMSQPYDAYDFEQQLAMEGESDGIDMLNVGGSPPLMYPDYKSQMSNGSSGSMDSLTNSKLKYQCPVCQFNTTTASRFHVHIVQHYNKRPFMCSACGYNSNWEWDITKHIRLKGCRDKSHNKACVLLTDESGRRNYEKYEKYLIDITQPIPVGFPSRLPELNGVQESNPKYDLPKPPFSETPPPSNKACSYDFRNIGSNFEDGPVNIVVTPDINLPEASENQSQDEYQSDLPDSMENGTTTNPNETKYFFCKHCDFKHSTKRVVVSHLSSHAGLKPFRCRACGMVSNWRHVIVRHVKDVHNGYMNEVEERINFVQEGYCLRLLSVSPTNEESNADPDKSAQQLFGCKICPYKCDKEFYMNFHMKQHRPREGAVFRCDYCPYFVKFKKTLVRHMRLHEPVPVTNTTNENCSSPVTESTSDQYTNDIYEFYDTQTNESNDDSIAISFNQLSQVDTDASPQKIKRHICEHCPYKTDNKTQYLYHKQFHRPNPTAPFKCNICTYWASMQHLLTQHMKVHTENDSEQNDSPSSGPKQFFEFFDDKAVPEKISVVYVKKGEETVKMFKCEFCPMMNKKKANVRVHQKMHGVVVNDGKFACTYCNYQCLNQGGLTNHMKVHQKGDDDTFSPKKLYDSMFEDDGTVVRKRSSSYFCFKCPAIFKTAGDLQNHQKFHGSTLPLKCTYCDYRAKHKPHITQHLAVHTAEYKAKRRASTPLNAQTNKLPEMEETIEDKEVVPTKKIDQMLLLEASEVKATLRKTGDAAKNLHKCIMCPASFFKTSVLVYHVSLHGSDGEFKCSQCDYAVNQADNLTVHSLVHPKKSPIKRGLKTFACPKCPGIFYKQDRYERHLELHGKNYKFACDQCDYSVRFAANIIKHKKVHAQKEAQLLENSGTENGLLSQSHLPLAEATNILDAEEKKITYICDRCPYFQLRKDAVQSHQRRHWIRDGFQCPYCDYSSMQNSFLQNHIKLHIQPNNLFPPQAFMKFQSFKIYVRDESNEETLLFDDETMVDKSSEESQSGETLEKGKEDDISEEKMGNSSTENLEIVSNIEEDANLTKPQLHSAGDETPKYFPDIRDDSHTESNLSTLSSSSCKSSKVPIVVLSDIYSNDKDLKKWGSRLKIPKLKISRKYARSSSSERSSKKLKVCDSPHSEDSNSKSRKSKPSLVVKIKVENCRVNKHEKTLYSVSTKSSDDQPIKEKESSIGSAENTNDSTSDMIFQDSEPSLPSAASISPVEDIEENTLTSNPGMDDALKADSSVENMMDSIVRSQSNDLVLSRPSDENIDLKSDDSFSNDTVPVVSDILCDKLDCLTELSFKDSDLSLTNGDCSTHLASNGLNLLPEEIKVGL